MGQRKLYKSEGNGRKYRERAQSTKKTIFSTRNRVKPLLPIWTKGGRKGEVMELRGFKSVKNQDSCLVQVYFKMLN